MKKQNFPRLLTGGGVSQLCRLCIANFVSVIVICLLTLACQQIFMKSEVHQSLLTLTEPQKLAGMLVTAARIFEVNLRVAFVRAVA